MGATVTVESAAFANALRRFNREVKGDTQKFILEQSGMFVKDAVKYTFPKKRMHGVKAVRRDISRAVTPLRINASDGVPATFDDIRDERLREKLNALLRAKNYRALEAILKKFRGEKTKVVRFSDRLHRSVRDSRGRVTRDQHTYTPDYKDWKKYRQKIEKRVGLHKHGWMGAVTKLRSLGVNIKLPAWIEKPRDKSGGSAAKLGGGDRMVFEMVNPQGYVKGAKETVRFVMGLRAKAINSGINRILRGGANRHGFTAR